MSSAKVTIEYCNKCKWQNRAVWYMQELLMTFDGKITEISLKPLNETPGIFKVSLDTGKGSKIIYQKRLKKTDQKQDEPYFHDGFPDSKFLKVLVRDELSPGENLGHLDRYQNYSLNDGVAQAQECKECNIQE